MEQNKPAPLIVAIMHTLYSETDYLGERDDQVRAKTEAQNALMERSELTLTSGSWLARELTRNTKFGSKIKPLVPGRVELIEPPGPKTEGTITAVGRLSFVNPVKQAEAVIAAYERLALKKKS